MMGSLEFLIDPREIRRRLGMNQQEFWSRVGVTQSGGSRYESGRRMPKPVRELLRLVHLERLDLGQIRKEDIEIVEHLKALHPDLYQSVKRAVRAKRTRGEQQSHKSPAHDEGRSALMLP